MIVTPEKIISTTHNLLVPGEIVLPADLATSNRFVHFSGKVKGAILPVVDVVDPTALELKEQIARL